MSISRHSRPGFLAASGTADTPAHGHPQFAGHRWGQRPHPHRGARCERGGKEHLAGFGEIPGVEIAAVVDPDQAVLDRRRADLAPPRV